MSSRIKRQIRRRALRLAASCIIALTVAGCETRSIDDIISEVQNEGSHTYVTCETAQCLKEAFDACTPAKWTTSEHCRANTEEDAPATHQEAALVVPDEAGGCWLAEFEHSWGSQWQAFSNVDFDWLRLYRCEKLSVTTDGCANPSVCTQQQSWDL